MSTYDVLLVDLDGTVYAGPDAIPGAVEALEAARGRSIAVAYVTNNASRAPGVVTDHLAELGLTVTEADVVTSAQAAATVLAEQLDPGSRVLVLGTGALADEVRGVGLVPVRAAADEPVALVQGHSTETGWEQLAEATLALGRGVLWVASNVDATLPSNRGLLPGNGSMVAALRAASGLEPQVAGKPAAPLLRQAVERAGAEAPLVVGDRLDTDIAGAHAIGADSLLVLTGVSTASDLLAAGTAERPTYVAAGLDALADLASVTLERHDGWTAEVDGSAVTLSAPDGAATDGPARAAALRALCHSWWPAGRDGLPEVHGQDEAAREVVAALRLPGGESG